MHGNFTEFILTLDPPNANVYNEATIRKEGERLAQLEKQAGSRHAANRQWDLFTRWRYANAIRSYPDHVIAELPLGGLRSEALPVENIPALMLTPEGDYPEDCLILHCHGGAYVSGKLIQAKAIAALVCGAAQIRTVTFAYRLAPEYPYPAAVEDALTVWNTLIVQGFSPNRIVLVGESAGGNLALRFVRNCVPSIVHYPLHWRFFSPWATYSKQAAKL